MENQIMGKVPVLCENCFSFFTVDNLVAAGTTCSFINCAAGPCPKCGGMGIIPDGTYEFLNKSIKLLTGSDFSKEVLRKLEKILREAKEKSLSIEVLEGRIEKEIPQAKGFLKWLPKNKSEYYGFIGLLIGLVGTIFTMLNSGSNYIIPDNEVIINNVLNNITINPKAKDTIYHPENLNHKKTMDQTFPNTKIGRNELCRCGSGKKFKKCHGARKNN